MLMGILKGDRISCDIGFQILTNSLCYILTFDSNLFPGKQVMLAA